MLDRLNRSLARWRFNRAAEGILRTAPARSGPGPLRVVSMLNRHHTRMYLLAIKSFLARVPGGEVHVLDDGTLGEEDRALVRRHVEGVTITPLASIDTGGCPRGGCWERLLHILDLSETGYVVQLDSDVLAAGPLPEVREAIAANRAFTLGTERKFGRVTAAEAAAMMAGEDASYLQVAAEQALAHVPPEVGGFYIRGSAGFAGFAQGGATRAQAEAFSRAMEAELGAERWRRWGTEQVASNFLVASSPGGEVLPWPRYVCFYARGEEENSALVHFIGSWRFARGVYVRLAQRVIGELPAAAPPSSAAA